MSYFFKKNVYVYKKFSQKKFKKINQVEMKENV